MRNMKDVGLIVLAGLISLSGCARMERLKTHPLGACVTFNEASLEPVKSRDHTTRGWKIDHTSFNDPRSILKHVVTHAPARAVVYPTERYYYYTFPLASRVISGNIRFVDADQGSISIGYFDAHNTADMKTLVFQDGKDGVRIETDPTGHEIRLTIDDITRTFILDQSAFTQPSFDLLPGEQFISGVRDESGYHLSLMYWPKDRAFYYVLNPDMPLPERLIRGESEPLEVWFGEKSRFCFVYLPRFSRHILVGVHAREIMNNTWFDGPFDQVPPNLPIRSILEQAYPYVIDAGGIDEHGNFLKMEGQRVAISPYRDYTSGPQLEADLQRLINRDDPTPGTWTNAVYESKKNWAPPAEVGNITGHQSDVSIAWPPNHWGSSSRTWPRDHRAATSTTWPPSHSALTSKRDAHPG